MYIGFDLDDTVFMPTARALEVFNRQGVMEINFSYFTRMRRYKPWSSDINRILVARHGREDFTVKAATADAQHVIHRAQCIEIRGCGAGRYFVDWSARSAWSR
jgi:hypothetical protein